jgi:hypothetical protein
MAQLTEAEKIQIHLLYRRGLIKMRDLEENDHVKPLSDRSTGLDGQVFSTFITPGRIARARSRATISRDDDSILYLAWCEKTPDGSFHYPKFVRIAFLDFFQTFHKLFNIIKWDGEKTKWLSQFEELMAEGQHILREIYAQDRALKKMVER